MNLHITSNHSEKKIRTGYCLCQYENNRSGNNIFIRNSRYIFHIKMDRNAVLKITSLWIVLSTLMSAFDLVNSAPFEPKTGKHIISSKSVLFMLEY